MGKETKQPLRVLFASSEAYPLIKTGGLADVAGFLPLALQKQGAQVTLVLPAYASVLQKVKARIKAYVPTLQGYALIRSATLKRNGPELWLVDHPLFSLREGNPYVDENGQPWPDNALRFGLFSQVIAAVIEGQASIRAEFDVVHCNDWQTGLIPAYLSLQNNPPATVFTIHNLAYQGVFPSSVMGDLQLPDKIFNTYGIEFYGHVSFIKGGLFYSDRINAVSPSYAEEIRSDDYSYGLAGLLQERGGDLSGIINGIDTLTWSPKGDMRIPQQYSSETLDRKAVNKRALQQQFGLVEDDNVMLLGNIGRMVEQKGIDIIAQSLPALMELPVQLAIVGTGEPHFEQALRDAAERWPGRVSCLIGYDENVAHLIEAGADVFLMPSRFEPCGLNQMYSQAYGTPPIVSSTGGLRDTVVHVTDETLADNTASGFFMPTLDAAGLTSAVEHALSVFHDKPTWQAIQTNGMEKDFSWSASASAYIDLYKNAISSSQAEKAA